MRRVLLMIVVFYLLLVTSCYEVNVNDSIFERAGTKVILSMENGREVSKDAKAVYSSTELDLDDSYYRDEVNGELYAADVTPEYFILDIDDVILYEPKDKKDPTAGVKDQAAILENMQIDGWIIPNRINMISSKNISNVTVSKNKLNKKWDGLVVNVRPGGTEGTNNMWAGSVFCVKLPTGITRSQVQNAIDPQSLPANVEHRDDDGYAWIGFSSAVPFSVQYCAYMCFQYKAEGVSFINSDHLDGQWTYGPLSCNGNQSGIVLPMDQVDFSNLKEVEFVFMFDTDKCMDIYKTGTNQYWITLKKSNPLPFKIVTQEYDSSSVVLAEEQIQSDLVPGPIQCFRYDWQWIADDPYLVFTYTRPNANGVDTVVIYSSETEVFSKETASEVYRGSDYCFYISATEENRKLYYFVASVDDEGRESTPVRFLNR